MAKSPIDMMLDGVVWKACEKPDNPDGLPYTTHEGVLTIMGHGFRVYQLDNGQRIVDADDLREFFTPMEG